MIQELLFITLFSVGIIFLFFIFFWMIWPSNVIYEYYDPYNEDLGGIDINKAVENSKNVDGKDGVDIISSGVTPAGVSIQKGSIGNTGLPGVDGADGAKGPIGISYGSGPKGKRGPSGSDGKSFSDPGMAVAVCKDVSATNPVISYYDTNGNLLGTWTI